MKTRLIYVENGKVTMTVEQLNKLIDEVYNEGYHDGYHWHTTLNSTTSDHAITINDPPKTQKNWWDQNIIWCNTETPNVTYLNATLTTANSSETADNVIKTTN